VVTVDDLRVARDLADELRARGSDRKARTLDQLIGLAENALDGPLAPAPPDLLSTGQAAKALGVSAHMVKTWAAGKFDTVRLAGRTMVVRPSLLAYLNSLRMPNEQRPAQGGETPEEAQQRAFITVAYPPELIQRLHDLVEVMEARRLTADEEAELERLDRQSVRITAERLRLWSQQQRASCGC
jgi:hypothetical protein